MLRPILTLLLTIATILTLQSQSLYTPRDIKQAYTKGTRSVDGRPGPHYWQNSGRYDITVTALPPDRIIRGTETIVYTNNSPDTLQVLDFRLTGNIHKPGIARAVTADSAYLTPGVIIDTYAENGQASTWHNGEADGTWKMHRLGKPLLPHDSVRLDISWHYLISLESNREGMIDSTTYYLAYFYPRIAVYDDYNGWDQMDFTDLQEFYNDFNNYTLHVKVPRNFIVWSTGILQNPEAVLTPSYARKLARSMTTDEIVNIATPTEIAKGKVTAQGDVNTWTWTAGNISDMALGLSDHYAWDASSVIVDNSTGRRASVQAAYNDTAKDFHHMVEYGRHALDWLSHNWPGVPYPFPKTTIFQGYADMEYPMMVNDNTTPDPAFSRFVAEHEIAHSWFPFYMGINESRFAFMDEGWATTYEHLIGEADLGREKNDDFYKRFRVNSYTYDPSSSEDLPIITPADALRGNGYGNNAYGKPSLAYLAVKDMLGDSLFRKCLHGYMERWHGKHPIPWDFFYSFDNISERDLNWFWTCWFFTNNYIDIAIKNVTGSNDNYTIGIDNVGGFAIPFDLVLTYDDGSQERQHRSAGVWEKNQAHIQVPITTAHGKKLTAVKLDNGIYVDANPVDNKWTAQ